MNVNGKRVLVLGLGETGLSMAKWLAGRGAGPRWIAIGADGPSDVARWLRERAHAAVPWPATLPQLWPAVLAALTGPLLE